MFTGIITQTGCVDSWQPSRAGGRLLIRTRQHIKDIKIGESIAVNGCCITAVLQSKYILGFDVSDETMRKTTFGHLREGDVVNLERALCVSDRLGGHFVLGHVDGIGKVKSVRENEGSVAFTIGYSKKFSALIIEKGSIAVDGISLTACDVTSNSFTVYIIPHTLKETNLGEREQGSGVNLEFDMLGKYAVRLMKQV